MPRTQTWQKTLTIPLGWIVHMSQHKSYIMCPSDDGNEGSYLIIAVNAHMGKHNQKQ